ncbi:MULTISPECIES: bifunctional homocysteine S-methyltransferase/methylenetetrahydrofolate reductase [Priestia]|uniref:Homocysteine methyltransferase n=1 Tax=Priestia veravalensis TaxID=1414648 RepID=A0A0V8JI67_9BACI|nr:MULTISPECIES: bifunctional homocysteine S-methyltransferase/methylenetetrahydrofolate reductase [Priestia]KSU86648.1 homocysteine methyltransferase [Priestia veravalensis]SCC49648.1 homocysteine S-methyltransferase [Priestia flexa]
MGLLEDLQSRILIGDGATGTLLYSHGIDSCFEELNITKKEEIQRIHRAYVEAGADVIQTNTYAANYQKLARYGLEDAVKDINISAVRIAKQAAKKDAYVVGTLGGIRSFQKNAISTEEVKRSIREQLFWLLNEGVDGLLFETYYDFEELKTVLSLARKETSKPIITHVSLHDIGVLQNGTSLYDAFQELESLGADVVGLNCRLGPSHMIQSLEEVPLLDRAFLSAYPNASLPAYVEGKVEYATNQEYFVESAKAFRNQGVRLVGGCCGTTPAHVQAMSQALKHEKPITQKKVKIRPVVEIKEQEQTKEPHLHDLVKERRSIIVELDPPKQLGPTKFLDGAKALHKAGVDAVTLADNSLASPRVSNLAMASLMQQQTDARPLVHITCRDRNLIGLQSHLMGLHTLGINQVLAITGDPSKIGDFPGATSVYDVSSFDLISLIAQFNEGLSYSGKPLGQKTNFSIAAAFNPNVRHLDRAVVRLEKKISYGAHYFITQPLYSTKQIEEVYEATKHLEAPIYIGIMPLTSARNARFIHHEVPGIKLSEDILARMDATGEDRIKGEVEGLAIAKDLIDTAYELFNGIYLITPFLRYEMTEILTRYINDKQLVTTERKN